jgi:hypothetical protein
MSHRSIEKKKIAKLRRALRQAGSTVPHHIDLIHYLKIRRIAQTTGHAEHIILAGRVVANSHKLGIVTVSMLKDGKVQDVPMVQPLVPASLRSDIMILPEKEDA